jgi:VWFA-related protein
MTAAASASLVDDFTTNRERSAAAIVTAAATKPHRQKALFNEDIYGAALQAAKSPNPLSRRVVVWLTDNLYDLSSGGHSRAEAVRALHEAGAVVTPMVLTDRVAAAMYPALLAGEDPAGRLRAANPPGDAHYYAEISGGQVFRVRGGDVSARLVELLDSLRSRYTIGYRPAAQRPAGSFCRLRVELTPASPLRAQEWSVLAREGYYRK